MVVISPQSRTWQRLGIVAFPVTLIVFTLDQTPPGCLRQLFGGTLLCLEGDPAWFWLYLIFLLAVVAAGLFALVQTFSQVEPEVLEHESALLRRWSEGIMDRTGGTLRFPARSLLMAWTLVALWFGPFLYLAVIHGSLSPDEYRLEFFGFLTFGTLFLWLPVRWCSESLLLTTGGIEYHTLLLWGGLRPWHSFRHIELRNDGNRGSQAIRLNDRWFRPDLVVNRNTIPGKGDFNLACRFIVHRMLEEGIPIHLPVGGVQEWIDDCRV